MGVLGFLLPLSPLSAERSYRVTGGLNRFVSAPGQYLVIYLLEGLAFSDLTTIFFAFLYAIIAVILAFSLTTNLGKLPVRGSVVLNSVFMNAINLPLPLLQLLTGSSQYAASYSVGSSLTQIISSKALQSATSSQKGSGTKFGFVDFVRFVPLMMVGVGAILHYTIWLNVQNASLSNIFETLLTFLLSLNFLYFGASLQKSIKSGSSKGTMKFRKPLILVGLFRTIIGPLITIGLALLFFLNNSNAFIELVFVGAMPPAITNTVLSGIYGFDESFSATSALIMTPVNIVEAFLIFYSIKLL